MIVIERAKLRSRLSINLRITVLFLRLSDFSCEEVNKVEFPTFLQQNQRVPRV